jgi:tetratricopeptide (TPR) repeat protein
MTTGVPNRLLEQSNALAAKGDNKGAIAELLKALEINPRAETIHYALAQRHAQAGDAAAALKWLGTAIARQPVVWKPRAAEDPIFQKLHARPEFQRLISK